MKNTRPGSVLRGWARPGKADRGAGARARHAVQLTASIVRGTDQRVAPPRHQRRPGMRLLTMAHDPRTARPWAATFDRQARRWIGRRYASKWAATGPPTGSGPAKPIRAARRQVSPRWVSGREPSASRTRQRTPRPTIAGENRPPRWSRRRSRSRQSGEIVQRAHQFSPITPGAVGPPPVGGCRDGCRSSPPAGGAVTAARAMLPILSTRPWPAASHHRMKSGGHRRRDRSPPAGTHARVTRSA